MTELAYNLKKSQSTGTERYSGFAAKLQAVLWWIHTPRGSKINRSNYGHDFAKHQHESMTTGTLQNIESGTVIGIERDIDVKIAAVVATPTQKDAICDIAIVVSDGTEIGLVADRVKA